MVLIGEEVEGLVMAEQCSERRHYYGGESERDAGLNPGGRN